MLISIFIQTHGQNEGKCYLINPAFNSGSQQGTWDKCNTSCPTSYPGATMLCVRTETENAWIKKISGQEIWIGYTDMLPYGGGKSTKQYCWVKGCNSTYTNWNTGEPNNAGDEEDFAYMYLGSGTWNDISATETRNCGCQ